jgi:aryl-alcohol dehydrogenase-like predicted oxidoreductase
MIDRIILGTANFSKKYNGVKVKGVDAILEYAEKVGIWAIDTATAYGTHHLEYPRKIVKVQADDVLFGDTPLMIMAHGVDAFERALSLCKEKDCYLGASIYPDDFDAIQEYKVKPAVVQLPYSVMDRRIEPYLYSMNHNGVQVHARSVFGRGKVLEKTDPFKALMFVMANRFIDKIVIGTESLQMLQDTIEPLKELEALDEKLDLRERECGKDKKK